MKLTLFFLLDLLFFCPTLLADHAPKTKQRDPKVKPHVFLFSVVDDAYLRADGFIIKGVEESKEKLEACGFEVVRKRVNSAAELERALTKTPPAAGEVVMLTSHGTDGKRDFPEGSNLTPGEYYINPMGKKPIHGLDFITDLQKNYPDNSFYFDTCFSGKCLSHKSCKIGVSCDFNETSRVPPYEGNATLPTNFLTTLLCDSNKECKYFKDKSGKIKTWLGGEEINELIGRELGSKPAAIKFTGYGFDKKAVEAHAEKCDSSQYEFGIEEETFPNSKITATYRSETGEILQTAQYPEKDPRSAFLEGEYVIFMRPSEINSTKSLQQNPDILSSMYRLKLESEGLEVNVPSPKYDETIKKFAIQFKSGKKITIEATVKTEESKIFYFHCVSKKKVPLVGSGITDLPQSPYFKSDFQIKCQKQAK